MEWPLPAGRSHDPRIRLALAGIERQRTRGKPNVMEVAYVDSPLLARRSQSFTAKTAVQDEKSGKWA